MDLPTTTTSPLFAPLSGIRVLDLSRMLAGPFATMVLADLGAEVVKVEHRRHGDETRAARPHQAGEGHYFIAANRGKQSLALDLTHPKAREVMTALVQRADVVVENWRPGKLGALGYSFEWMKGCNDRIILCSISGFGQDGPEAGRASFDLVGQALSGLMSINGEPESGPTKLGLPLADLGAGLWAAIAVLAALTATPRSPAHLDISMRAGLAGLLGYLGQLHLATGEDLPPLGSSHPTVAPYGRFQAADGWVVVILPTGRFWRRFCTAVGREELIHDPRFRTSDDRRRNRDLLNQLVADIVRQRTTAEWEALFRDADVPGGPVLTIGEAIRRLDEPGRSLLTDVVVHGQVIRSVGTPVRAVGASPPTRQVVPGLGEHTHRVLADHGLTPAAIAELHACGVVGADPGHHRAQEG